MKGVVRPNLAPVWICKPMVLVNQKLQPAAIFNVCVVGGTNVSFLARILNPNHAETYGSMVPDLSNL